MIILSSVKLIKIKRLNFDDSIFFIPVVKVDGHISTAFCRYFLYLIAYVDCYMDVTAFGLPVRLVRDVNGVSAQAMGLTEYKCERTRRIGKPPACHPGENLVA